jgi:hypothetical protein
LGKLVRNIKKMEIICPVVVWLAILHQGWRDMPISGASFAEEDNPANPTNGIQMVYDSRETAKQYRAKIQRVQSIPSVISW